MWRKKGRFVGLQKTHIFWQFEKNPSSDHVFELFYARFFASPLTTVICVYAKLKRAELSATQKYTQYFEHVTLSGFRIVNVAKKFIHVGIRKIKNFTDAVTARDFGLRILRKSAHQCGQQNAKKNRRSYRWGFLNFDLATSRTDVRRWNLQILATADSNWDLELLLL